MLGPVIPNCLSPTMVSPLDIHLNPAPGDHIIRIGRHECMYDLYSWLKGFERLVKKLVMKSCLNNEPGNVSSLPLQPDPEATSLEGNFLSIPPKMVA